MNNHFNASPQQLEIFDEINSGDGHLIIQARAGCGKCLGAGTPVLKYDLSVVPVEEIRKGDVLMGPDSLPRRVLSTTTGTAPMYQITPVKGDPWTCNDIHIMTVKGTNRFMGEIMDAPLTEFLSCRDQNGRLDKQWKLFRVPLEFAPSPVPFDPYMVGSWLGDGTVGTWQWTLGVEKKPIVEYLRQQSESLGVLFNLRWDDDNNSWSVRFGMRNREHADQGFTKYERFEKQDEFLETTSCGMDKFIHPSYIRNSRAVRAALLAGLLDTDGSATSGGFDITTKYEGLKDSILLLARSLGFSAFSSIKKVKLDGWEEPRDYFRISIFGDSSFLPLLRHHPQPRRQVKDVLKTGWDAQLLGTGQYYGFTLDGDGRFLLGDLTVTHNTTTLLQALKYMHGDVFMGAFNKAIATEIQDKVGRMRGLPCRVDVKTLHAAGLSAYKYGGGSKTANIESNKIRLLIEELAEKTKNSDYLEYEQFLYKLVGFAKRAGVGLKGEGFDHKDDIWTDLIDYYSVADELPDSVYDQEGEVPDAKIQQLVLLAKKIFDVSLDTCKDEIDFDDMLLAPLHFGCNFRKYDWVLIDELQDCSPIRQEIAYRMLKSSGRLIGVGDPAQNIFGFTGCSHDEMESFTARLKAKVLPLSITYRCPKLVVGIANTWVPDLEAHETAPEGTVRQIELEPTACMKCNGIGTVDSQKVTDGAVVCPSCKGSCKSGPGFWDEAHLLGPESVIICRNNKPIVELAYQLLRKGIPCKIEGRDFAGSLIKLCQRWKTRELNTLETRLVHYRDTEAAKWRKKKNDERAVAIEDKVDTLLALLDAVRSSGKTRVTDLIDKINQMFADTDQGSKPKVLTLSSIHKAKGKEWERVFILGRNRYQPSKWARQPHEIQAEDNISYVAVTRSKSELVDVHVSGERKRKY